VSLFEADNCVCSWALDSSAEKVLEALLVSLACKHQRCARSLPLPFLKLLREGIPGRDALAGEGGGCSLKLLVR